jgi:hypothetical protein
MSTSQSSTTSWQSTMYATATPSATGATAPISNHGLQNLWLLSSETIASFQDNSTVTICLYQGASATPLVQFEQQKAGLAKFVKPLGH